MQSYSSPGSGPPTSTFAAARDPQHVCGIPNSNLSAERTAEANILVGFLLAWAHLVLVLHVALFPVGTRRTDFRLPSVGADLSSSVGPNIGRTTSRQWKRVSTVSDRRDPVAVLGSWSVSPAPLTRSLPPAQEPCLSGPRGGGAWLDRDV